MSSDRQSFSPVAPAGAIGDQLEQHVRERTAILEESNLQLRQEIQRLTERETALRESEEQYRMIFEQAAAGFAHVGLDGTFLNVNQQMCEMFGYLRNQLLTKRWAELTHPADLTSNFAKAEQMVAGEFSTYCTEKRYIRQNGSAFWADLTATLVRAADGQPKYFVSVIVDISQRKHAQELLRKSEQRLQSILDHTTAVIYIKDPRGRYELVNRRYEELFHTTCQEILGQTDFDVFPQEWAQKFRTNDLKIIETRMPLELEEVVPQDDGLHTYLSVKVPILDASGRPVAICGISTDITERKRAEAEMREAKESAEQASLAKSRFLANISHEIRTPIMAMLGAAEVIRGDELAVEEVHDRGEVILRNGRHLLALVDDLLDQSRIDAGRLDVVRTSCSLPEIMADVYAITSPLFKDQIDFQIIYETSVPEAITTDRTRLVQAVVNLVHNAIKFTSQGHVHVKVRLDRVEQSPFLTILVEDTGKGIAHTDTNRIFEPFTQLGKTQNALGGMGLGLHLARGIAQRLGGSLDVRSRLGVGSLFTLRIPVGPLESQEWITAEEAGQWLRLHKEKSFGPLETLSGTVLLAEDSEDVRKLLTYALEKAGATVIAVADGKTAVETARQRHFDLILLDIRMPEMSGLDAARAIRNANYSGPLIALTASTTRTEQEILKAGFDELWSKPISLKGLVKLASAFLHSQPLQPVQTSEKINDRLAVIRAEFARGLPARMGRLHTALANNDLNTAGQILHQVVGSSGIHGYMDFSEQAQVVYTQCKSGELSPHSAELLRLYEMARQISAE